MELLAGRRPRHSCYARGVRHAFLFVLGTSVTALAGGCGNDKVLPMSTVVPTGPSSTTGASPTASSGGAGAAGGMGGSVEPGPSGATMRVEGRRMLLDGETFVIRGVCWNPVPKGGHQNDALDFDGFVDLDAPLMAAAGINAVRTYTPIVEQRVLDVLYAHGIYVLNAAYTVGGDPVSAVDARVAAVKDHPAVAGWVVGNEWNYNNLYSGLSPSAARNRVEEVAARLQTLDERPVITIYGEVPEPSVVAAIPSADVWGLNIYAGLGLNGAFNRWGSMSGKPMFLGEYGADAYDAGIPGPNLAAQATATRVLTELIFDNLVTDGGVGSGGTIFEWADEWWKDESGSLNVHDTSGIAPGGGPHPDATFNEEWWGIVDIDRVPRPAYDALKSVYAP